MSDFSCYVNIKNNSPIPNTLLTRRQYVAVHGDWATEPPTQIQMGDTGSFQVKDPAGAVGSQGWVMYDVSIDGQFMGNIVFSFQDPYNGENSVAWNWSPTPISSLSVSFVAYSDNNPPLQNGIQSDGHPVYVTYTVA